MFEPLTRDRLYKGIVDQVMHSVMTGQMRPGDQLPTEPELAEQFGVSRTVVREAIKALVSQGLVDVSPGRGAFITQPPIETVINSLYVTLKLEDHGYDDLLVARQLLEAPIARLAAENATAENKAALARHLSLMSDHRGDPAAFISHDTAFHAELARATQNTVLTILIQPIISLLQGMRETVVRFPDIPVRATYYHQLIYQAVVAKDGPGAEQAMRDHLAQVAEDVERARQAGLLDRKGSL